MESIESVSASCSVRLCVRRDSVVVIAGAEGMDVAVDVPMFRSSFLNSVTDAVLRARSVDSGSGSNCWGW